MSLMMSVPATGNPRNRGGFFATETQLIHHRRELRMKIHLAPGCLQLGVPRVLIAVPPLRTTGG